MNTEAKMLIGTGLLTVVIIAVGVWLSSRSSAPTEIDPARLVHADSYQTLPSAKVAVVEFGDFQCPSCAAVHPLLKQLKADYKDKVNFVYRNFPLPMHKNAQVAAEAAAAAADQGKFWEMHDMLFDNQNEWAESTTAKEIFAKYALNLNLDAEAFKKALDAETFADKVSRDQADGYAVDVNGTPTIFINNKRYLGNFSMAAFKAEIDKQLNQ